MTRINTNVTSLIAQRVLRNNNKGLSTSLERLSTGLKINTAADNPAGLIASENLRAEKSGITQAIDNAGRASNLIGTAEGGLGEISSLLTEVQGLVSQSASSGGLSSEEIQANQLQVDSILNTVNRIAKSTSFEGMKLLDGSYAYTASASNAADFTDVRVNAARRPDGQNVSVVVAVTAAATQADIAGPNANLAANDTIELVGSKGSEQITFATGTSVGSMTTAINSYTNATGVYASAVGGALHLYSSDFGSKQFVSVTSASGAFTAAGTTKANGTDATVKVNGASAQSDGLTVSFRSADLDVETDLSTTANAAGNYTFTITGGGANFALGAKVSENDKASIGIASVSTAGLGDSTSGKLDTLATGGANELKTGNLVTAQKIVDKAVKQVAQLRARLGAFQKFTLDSTTNSLSVALENASAADSAIRDTDFAQETANMTRQQILSQASQTVLAQANTAPQSALALLRGG